MTWAGFLSRSLDSERGWIGTLSWSESWRELKEIFFRCSRRIESDDNVIVVKDHLRGHEWHIRRAKNNSENKGDSEWKWTDGLHSISFGTNIFRTENLFSFRDFLVVLLSSHICISQLPPPFSTSPPFFHQEPSIIWKEVKRVTEGVIDLWA